MHSLMRFDRQSPAREARRGDDARVAGGPLLCLLAVLTVAATAETPAAAEVSGGSPVSADAPTVAAAAAPRSNAAGSASTLYRVRAAGVLRCGINRAATDFSKNDTHGNLAALDADICKAVGVAVLGPGAAIAIKALPDEPRTLGALQRREVDLVAGASPTDAHRRLYGVGFAPAVFNDGQGFLIRKASGVRKLEDFAHKQICYIANTRADATLVEVFGRRHIAYIPFPFEEQGEMEAALFTGHCAATTGDLSQLADTRYGFRRGAPDFVIGTDIIRDDPVAPAYRADDAAWAAIVDGTVVQLLRAESAHVTAATVDAAAQSVDPAPREFAASASAAGEALGLDEGWAVRVIRAVGNYGEIFDRDLGKNSPLGLDRGAGEPPIHSRSLSVNLTH